MANEKRLIDANGSYTLNANDNTEHSLCFGGGIINVMDQRGRCICEFDAEDAPTVDAVEVVRCGECWAYNQPDCPMSGSPGRVSVSDFCSYGERRNNETIAEERNG